ncbi:hypothetical protein [Bacillus toyonensis]|nr:hypothetical protein [Bacillus toyonensis]
MSGELLHTITYACPVKGEKFLINPLWYTTKQLDDVVHYSIVQF